MQQYCDGEAMAVIEEITEIMKLEAELDETEVISERSKGEEHIDRI